MPANIVADRAFSGIVGAESGLLIGEGPNQILLTTNADGTALLVDGVANAIAVAPPTGIDSVDRAAINAAMVTAGTSTGIVQLDYGTYAVDSTTLNPVNGVWLRGKGIGATTLKPSGNFAAIKQLNGGGSPLTRFKCTDLTIDGANHASTYSTAMKGIYITGLKDCTFRNLEIINTGATGFGCDFHTNTLIENLIVDNCGRLNGGSGAGGAGIGLGAGNSLYESCTVQNCFVSNSGRNGIFVEAQTATASTGYRIVNCYVTSSAGHGIADAGTQGTIISGCTSILNGGNGIAMDSGTYVVQAGVPMPGSDGIVTNCTIWGNTGHGVYYDGTVNQVQAGYEISHNMIKLNGGDGIRYAVGTAASRQLRVLHNRLYKNSGSGFNLFQAGSGSAVDLDVIGNILASNTVDGIQLNASVTRGEISGNRSFQAPSGALQVNGLNVVSGTTLTNVRIKNNDTSQGNTNVFTLAGTLTTCHVLGNIGYPSAATAAQSVGASPWTFTAPAWGGVLYLFGGTVSSVTKSGVQIASATGIPVFLAPNQACVVTYSSLPTAVLDVTS